MILLQPKNPKGLKLHEAMEEKGLDLAVLSAGMTFSTLKISVGALLFGKNNRSSMTGKRSEKFGALKPEVLRYFLEPCL